MRPLLDFFKLIKASKNKKKVLRFYIAYRELQVGRFDIDPQDVQPLLQLDQEDLDYLARKYAPKLKEEMEIKLKRVEHEYATIDNYTGTSGKREDNVEPKMGEGETGKEDSDKS